MSTFNMSTGYICSVQKLIESDTLTYNHKFVVFCIMFHFFVNQFLCFLVRCCAFGVLLISCSFLFVNFYRRPIFIYLTFSFLTFFVRIVSFYLVSQNSSYLILIVMMTLYMCVSYKQMYDGVIRFTYE